MIKVLLVDDNALFRDGIVQILHADGRFQVVGQASDGAEGIAAAGRLRPDLILMDLRMPGMGGVEAIRAIRADAPQVPIGVLTMFESADSVQSALQAGASGYVAKDATPDDFCEAASSLAQGTRHVIAIPNALATRTNGNLSSVLLARLIEPFRHLLVAGAVLDLRLEIGAFHTFEPEKHIIEGAIEMVFADIPRHQGPAFVDGPA